MNTTGFDATDAGALDALFGHYTRHVMTLAEEDTNLIVISPKRWYISSKMTTSSAHSRLALHQLQERATPILARAWAALATKIHREDSRTLLLQPHHTRPWSVVIADRTRQQHFGFVPQKFKASTPSAAFSAALQHPADTATQRRQKTAH